MAENKKIDKALYGPSTFEVALGALLGLLVGVIAACVFLAFKPIKTVKEMPKEPALGAVYYLPGRVDGSKGRTWSDKQKQLLAGSPIYLTEEELNAWAAAISSTPPPPAAKPAAGKPAPGKPAPAKPDEKSGEPTPPPAGFFTAGTLVFRLTGNQLQVGTKCTLNYFGLATEFQVVATGGFTKKDNHVVFSPEKFYFGSCPLHKLPMLAGVVLPRIYASQKISDELSSAWEKVTEVAVEKDLLKVTTAP
jgi:hypothetical protein